MSRPHSSTRLVGRCPAGRGPTHCYCCGMQIRPFRLPFTGICGGSASESWWKPLHLCYARFQTESRGFPRRAASRIGRTRQALVRNSGSRAEVLLVSSDQGESWGRPFGALSGGPGATRLAQPPVSPLRVAERGSPLLRVQLPQCNLAAMRAISNSGNYR